MNIVVASLAAASLMISSIALANSKEPEKKTEDTKDPTGRNIISPYLVEGSGGSSISSYDGSIGSGHSGHIVKHTSGCGFNQAGAKPGVYAIINGKHVFLRCGDK